MRFPFTLLRTRDLLLPALVALPACAACDSDDENDGPAVATDYVTVAYEGRLADGTVFDQNDRASFSLRRVIPGFRDGIVGMRVGETRTFDVPPEQGYGDNPPESSIIPPGATLTFEVTLLGIR